MAQPGVGGPTDGWSSVLFESYQETQDGTLTDIVSWAQAHISLIDYHSVLDSASISQTQHP